MSNVKEFAQELANNGVQVSFVETPPPSPCKLYKNIEMEQMLAVLEKHLGRADKIGYAAARNTRILQTESKEYFEFRERLVEKYGKPQMGDDGEPTGLIELRFDSPEFSAYAKEIEEWALIEHAPSIYKIPAEEVVGKLTGAEILEIDWMLEE